MDITGQILSIAGACIVSAGGIGAIIIGVIKFTSNSIADALSKKYELKLNKELELYKCHIVIRPEYHLRAGEKFFKYAHSSRRMGNISDIYTLPS